MPPSPWRRPSPSPSGSSAGRLRLALGYAGGFAGAIMSIVPGRVVLMQVFTPDCAITEFDTATPAVDRIRPGEYVEVETADCYDGQITGPDVLRPMIDMSRFNRAIGPIDVEGVRAGDWIRVTLEEITVGGTGVMALRPGIGILGAEVEETSSLIVDVADGVASIDGVTVPISPMIGVIGVAAEEPISSSTPGRHGGNLDTRIITAGSQVLLRAQRDGAGLALGDLHAAQGDGELGGTGIEIAGRAAFADAVLLVQARHEVPWGDAYRLASILATTHISQVVTPRSPCASVCPWGPLRPGRGDTERIGARYHLDSGGPDRPALVVGRDDLADRRVLQGAALRSRREQLTAVITSFLHDVPRAANSISVPIYLGSTIVGMEIRERRQAAGMSQAQLARAARVPQPNISAYESGRRSPSPAVLERLRGALEVPLADKLTRHRDAIHELVAEYHASDPRVFGSVARGDDGLGADLDLLVDFSDKASLIDEVGVRLALHDLLQVDVDVVGADSLRGEVRDRILREAVPL